MILFEKKGETLQTWGIFFPRFTSERCQNQIQP